MKGIGGIIFVKQTQTLPQQTSRVKKALCRALPSAIAQLRTPTTSVKVYECTQKWWPCVCMHRCVSRARYMLLRRQQCTLARLYARRRDIFLQRSLVQICARPYPPIGSYLASVVRHCPPPRIMYRWPITIGRMAALMLAAIGLHTNTRSVSQTISKSSPLFTILHITTT